MNRRKFIIQALALTALPLLTGKALASKMAHSTLIKKIVKTKEEWRQVLTPKQYYILRDAGTEAPNSSELNQEKRKGEYVCAGCDLPLFKSDMKYESGTGWPSFFTTIPGALETKTDYKIIFLRTEYHCARCEGHQGHVFKDGPKPTGKRWCNNGLAIKFIPA